MKRVLIVEDDPTWAMLVGKYVRQLDWEYVVVSSPQAAMDALDTQPVDVIVLDMLLAVETGMALLNEIRSYDDLATIPIVAFTNMNTVSLASLRRYGVQALLDKAAVMPEEVQHTLKELVYGRE
jgi:CheY-like chemotaxis protein